MAEFLDHRRKLVAGAVAALIAVGGLALWAGGLEAERSARGAWDPVHDAGLAVVTRGRTWRPATDLVVEKPAEDMLEVGSQAGVTLWAERPTGGGGGEGTEAGNGPGPRLDVDGLPVAPADRIERGVWGVVYVRDAAGRFVPLVTGADDLP